MLRIFGFNSEFSFNFLSASVPLWQKKIGNRKTIGHRDTESLRIVLKKQKAFRVKLLNFCFSIEVEFLRASVALWQK